VKPTSSKASTEHRTGRGPLAVPTDSFRSAGHELVDRIADLLTSMPGRPVSPGEAPDRVRAALGSEASLPEDGRPLREVLGEATDLLLEHSTFNGHPRFFGYITSAPAPVGMLADLLAAAVNPNVGGWSLSPMASEIEGQTVRWIAELLGFPRECGGLLVSGGNMANLSAFWAARVAVAGPGVRRRGLSGTAGGDGFRVYVSRETHTWVEKAADLSGLGTDAVRWLPTDDELRMDVDALVRALDEDAGEGIRPLMVVGTAGTVSTGAVDPLREMAAVCRERDIWFHVDGAYGGFAAALPDASPDLRALAEADSLAVDPHKWLYAPLEAGCVLVRDPRRLPDAFSYHPPYYHFGGEATNYLDHGPQNSRGFRALKVWLALKQVGRAGYRELIAGDIALARRLFEGAQSHPELEALTHHLSIATLRYLPERLAGEERSPEDEEYLDELNRALLRRLERSGEVFLSNAVLRSRFVLRACIVNFRTCAQDIDAVPGIVARHGREVDRELGER